MAFLASHPFRLRRIRLALACAIGLIATLLCAVPPADAKSPTAVSASVIDGHIAVNWSLPADSYAVTVEVAGSPATDSDGYFTDPGTYFYDAEAIDESLTVPDVLPPGRYYVHVGGLDMSNCAGCLGGSDADCANCPNVEFSRAVVVDLPGSRSSGGQPAARKQSPVREGRQRCKRRPSTTCKSKRAKHRRTQRSHRRHRPKAKTVPVSPL